MIHKEQSYSLTNNKKIILFGAIGGFVAGLVMLPFLMLTAILAGMPANTMPVAMGLSFGSMMNNAMAVGVSLHFITSIIIGILFGIVISKVNKLKINSLKKGTLEGLFTGMIAFVVLFIPISMFVMPPVLTNMMVNMNPAISSQQQAMSMLMQGMPMMFGMGILEHLVYGAVLGIVTAVLILKSTSYANKQNR